MSEITRLATLELTSVSRGSAGVSIFTAQPLERVGRRKPAHSIGILELSTIFRLCTFVRHLQRTNFAMDGTPVSVAVEVSSLRYFWLSIR